MPLTSGALILCSLCKQSCLEGGKLLADTVDLTEMQTLAALSHASLGSHPSRSYRHAPDTRVQKGWASR